MEAVVPNGSSRRIRLPASVGSSVSAMRTGILLLTVPLMNDVIQVGSVGTGVHGTIEIAKTPSAMVVRRIDGRPLQAQILHQRADGSELRTPVFSEPVRALRLRRVGHAEAPGRWLVSPGSRVRRPADLFQLVETITAFGLAKQLRTSRFETVI